MNATPTLRRMWSMYKELLIENGMSRRDQIIAQEAFYSGARGVLKVLDHLVEGGEVEELQRVIRHHGRTIRGLQGRRRAHGGIDRSRRLGARPGAAVRLNLCS